MANLLIVSGYWPSRDNPISGIFIVEQIRAFTELGHKVWVVVGQAIGRAKDLMSLQELGLDVDAVTLLSPRFLRAPEKLSHLPLIFCFNVRNVGAFIAHAIRHIHSSGARIDGALVHDLRYNIASTPFWRPLVDAPVVGLIHGIDPLLDRGSLSPKIVNTLRSGLDCLNEAGIVGSLLKKHIEGIGLDPNRFQMVSNGTEIPKLVDCFHGANLSSTRTKKILSVSRLCAWKGVDDTLRALAMIDKTTSCSNWELRVVGDGEERSNLESLVFELGISEKVYFCGRLDREATLNEFNSCDLFCLPSWAEPFGIVYLEAMARGRPVIGCNNCGPADFVAHGEDGLLVPPQSPEVLAATLRMLWENPNKLAQIARAGREKAEGLTWKRNAQQIIELLGLT